MAGKTTDQIEHRPGVLVDCKPLRQAIVIEQRTSRFFDVPLAGAAVELHSDDVDALISMLQQAKRRCRRQRATSSSAGGSSAKRRAASSKA